MSKDGDFAMFLKQTDQHNGQLNVSNHEKPFKENT